MTKLATCSREFYIGVLYYSSMGKFDVDEWADRYEDGLDALGASNIKTCFGKSGIEMHKCLHDLKKEKEVNIDLWKKRYKTGLGG